MIKCLTKRKGIFSIFLLVLCIYGTMGTLFAFLLSEILSSQVEENLLNISGRTMITITHRLNSRLLRRYDEILILDKGKIVKSGTFAELYDKKEYLYGLCKIGEIAEEGIETAEGGNESIAY